MAIVQDVPSTIIGQIGTAPSVGSPGTISFRGAVFKAILIDSTLSPAAGDTVLADYLATSSEFVITQIS